MKVTRIIEHEERGTWWAESPDAPGFSAAGLTRDAVRSLVEEAANLWGFKPFAYVGCPREYIPTISTA